MIKTKLPSSPLFGLEIAITWHGRDYLKKSFNLSPKNPLRINVYSHPLDIEIDGILLITKNVVSNIWLEKALLYTILRTPFVSYLTSRGRYSFNFEVMPKIFIRKLIDYILNYKGTRINYSWVAPLQDLILISAKPTTKSKRGSKQKYDGDNFLLPEPESATKQAWKTQKLSGIIKKYSYSGVKGGKQELSDILSVTMDDFFRKERQNSGTQQVDQQVNEPSKPQINECTLQKEAEQPSQLTSTKLPVEYQNLDF